MPRLHMFDAYLMLVFMVVVTKDTNLHQLFATKEIFTKYKNLAANPAGAFLSSPMFDPLFERE